MSERSKAVGHEPCPKCREKGGDYDGDNLVVFDDGHKHCFACNHHENNKEGQQMSQSEETLSTQYIKHRGISANTFRVYKSPVLVNDVGRPLRVAFHYPRGVKERSFEQKQFRTTGDMSTPQLFGMDRFEPGSAKAITIAEGEYDAMSIYEMMGSKYPVVSVRSASTADADVSYEPNFKYLDSFDAIYLALDNDEAGRAAAQAIARNFDFNKVFYVKMGNRKDANEYLEAGEGQAFTKMWWNARRFIPDNIVSSYSDIDEIIDNDKLSYGIPYPWGKLNEMSYGMHPGQFILVTAQEGVGKTEIIRAIEYTWLQEAPEEDNLGIIHLEENKARSIKGLVGYHLRVPVHLPDSMVSNEDIKKAYRALTKRNDRVHYYSHFGSDDPRDIMGVLQFMAGPMKCRMIVLDHISMVVSGLDGEDERKQLDWLSTRLKMMAESLGVILIVVSHVNDDGKTRGSRNISKVADLRIDVNRDLIAEDENRRNTTFLTISKNRLAGRTGPAGVLFFDKNSYTLVEQGELPT